MVWGDKPYHSLDYELKRQFGQKIYKVSLDGGMSCPNRDGTVGTGGCTFCSQGGSGEFAVGRTGYPDVWEQIEQAKTRVHRKISGEGKYIAYFQSYTNTYAPVDYLRTLFERAITHPDIVALSVGTRPDCLGDEVVALLKELNGQKPVWVELGLQTIHEKTAERIHRGYRLEVFEDAYRRLKEAGLTVVVHVILGLPGETKEEMLETVDYLGKIPVDGIKLQLLHILKGSQMAAEYEKNPFSLMELEEYLDLILTCVARLPQSVVIHRLSGDGAKALLIGPAWSANKKLVLNRMMQKFRENGIFQGCQRAPQG
ncbi:MAG: TIGR01212 family radical SAM protein [Lachnospiraceae bacterium]|nr:TIGR01212 family radical SAM protein [Lachnospiraceae bacterium]